MWAWGEECPKWNSVCGILEKAGGDAFCGHGKISITWQNKTKQQNKQTLEESRIKDGRKLVIFGRNRYCGVGNCFGEKKSLSSILVPPNPYLFTIFFLIADHYMKLI